MGRLGVDTTKHPERVMTTHDDVVAEMNDSAQQVQSSVHTVQATHAPFIPGPNYVPPHLRPAPRKSKVALSPVLNQSNSHLPSLCQGSPAATGLNLSSEVLAHSQPAEHQGQIPTPVSFQHHLSQTDSISSLPPCTTGSCSKNLPTPRSTVLWPSSLEPSRLSERILLNPSDAQHQKDHSGFHQAQEKELTSSAHCEDIAPSVPAIPDQGAFCPTVEAHRHSQQRESPKASSTGLANSDPTCKRGRSKWPTKEELKMTDTRSGEHDSAQGCPSIPGPLESMSNEPASSHEEREKKQTFESLADWDGKWAPAPIEWDERSGYVDKRLRHHIANWLERMSGPLSTDISTTEFKQSIQVPDGLGSLVMPSTHEEVKLDPQGETSAAQRLQTAQASALEFTNTVLRKERDRKTRKYLRREHERMVAEYIPPPNPNRPKANIYVRYVRPTDVNQIVNIYNHYVANSIRTAEMKPTTLAEMKFRIKSMLDPNLPCFVAVEKDTGHPVTSGKEEVYGFIWADDYQNVQSAWRFTVEIEVYAHPNRLRVGVGKTLMDALLRCLDPKYLGRGGYTFNEENPYKLHSANNKSRRPITTILCGLHYDPTDEDEVAWLKTWLDKVFEFDHCGSLKGGFRKFQKTLDIVWMGRTTSVRLARGQ